MQNSFFRWLVPRSQTNRLLGQPPSLPRFIGLWALFTLLTVPPVQAQVLSLEQLIQLSWERNQGLQAQKLAESVAKAKLNETRGGYLPSVVVQGQHTYSPELATSLLPGSALRAPIAYLPVQLNAPWQSSLVAELNQVLYSGGLIAGIRSAKEGQTLERLETIKDRETLALGVAGLYYGAIVVQSQLRLVEANRQTLRRVQASAQQNLATGMIKRTDAERVAVNVSTLDAAASELASALAQQQNSLRFLAGLSNQTPIVLPDTLEPIQPDSIPAATALDRSPGLQQLGSRKRLAELERKGLIAEYFPAVSAFGQVGNLTYGDDLAQSLGSDYSYSFSTVGLRLRWTLFDGAAREAKLARNRLEQQQIDLQQQLATNDERTQLENAQVGLRASRSNLQSQMANLKLAERINRDAAQSFQSGLISVTDLLQTDASLKEAQSQYLQSLASYCTALVAYQRHTHRYAFVNDQLLP